MYYLDPWNGGDDVRPKPQPKTPAYWQDVWGRVCDPLDPLQFDSCGMVFKSSLSTLEYWPKLKLNHLLDPMHIEGNIGKSLIKHLFGEKGVEWRKACVEQNMHPDLWSYKNDDGRIVLPSCPWILSKEEKRELIRRIGSYRMPTDYGANLRRAFGEYGQDKWPSYLKTHDFHRLLQQILPVALIGLGSSRLQKAVWDMGRLLRWVCGKTISVDEIPAMEVFSVEVVCGLEQALPPSFFDCQVHLLIHLVREVALAGPVHCRWMYWVEREMGTLKSYVRNYRWVEGSIAEGHLAAESMFYCSNIISTIDPNAQRAWMEDNDTKDHRLTGARKRRQLTSLEVKQINLMMLTNSDATEEWRDYYESEKSLATRPRIFPKFEEYLRRKLTELEDMENTGEDVSTYPEVTNEIRTLAKGPLYTVITRTAMWSQGRHFRIADLDDKKKVTQDCGVMAQFTTNCRSSRHDQNVVTAMVPWYGKVEEILVLTYDSYTKIEVVLFKCRWFKTNLVGGNVTLLHDDCGFTRLKTSASSTLRQDWATSDPFTFPHQVEQCFYLPYPQNPDEWSIVIPYTPRSRNVVQEHPEVVVVEDVDQ
jgi:hypothetical protein